MIYTTYIMTFATFSYSKSPRFAFLVGLGLFSLALFITVSISSAWALHNHVVFGPWKERPLTK